MSEVFLDTSYAIALSVSNDSYHQRALELAQTLQLHQTKIVTTDAILLEIGNALSRVKYRSAAVNLLHAIMQDPQVESIPISSSLFQQGVDLFSKRLDKEWGLIDCISFVVMEDYGIINALTADYHFEQAGFVALLRIE